MLAKNIHLNFLIICTIIHLINGACEDIQSQMDGTIREECNSTQKIRGGQVCVPLIAGPLLLETRQLSSQPLAMRSFTDQQSDSRILIGYYPKWDKCFIIRRTNCAIKGALIELLSSTIYWIELCPTTSAINNQNGASLHRINLDGSNYASFAMLETFENWFSLQIQVDAISAKLYIITYNSVLECNLEGQNCVAYDRLSEDVFVSFSIDSHRVNMINRRG